MSGKRVFSEASATRANVSAVKIEFLPDFHSLSTFDETIHFLLRSVIDC